jgi:adenosine deaminase
MKHLKLQTDDKGLFSTTLSNEYYLAAREAHLSKSELFDLSYKSIDFIFGGNDIKEKLRQHFLQRKVVLVE